MASIEPPFGPVVRSRLWTPVGLVLAVVHFGLLYATLDIGFPRDEGFYFSAAEQYSRWIDDLIEDPVKAFSRETVERRFASNPEHPALPKFLFGLSWRLFGQMDQDPSNRFWYDGGRPPRPIFGWLDEATAMRLPALLLAAFLVFMVFRFGVVFFGLRVGLGAAMTWALMPHAFWHSHLACFDVPVTAMWFLTAYCYLRAESGGGWRWAIWTGVAWGLALSTKHNAYFLPVVFLLHFLGTRAKEFRIARGPDGRIGIRLPSVPLSWLAMLLISPIIYFALWPKLWFDPIGHLKWYFGRHAYHEYYWAYYFGTLYTKPPFPIGFPFVMSAMTIPAPTILLGFVGLVRLVLGHLGGQRHLVPRETSKSNGETLRSGTLWFVFLNFLIPFAVIAHPKVPIFGGTKHWMHGLPFFALFAGVGFDWTLRHVQGLAARFRSARLPSVAAVTAALIIVTPLLFDTLRGHTNGSTYYQALVGGFGAMGEHRMQREFWGNTAFSALQYINREAWPGARVDFHDTAWDSVRMYRRTGLLRPDIVPVWDYRQADFFLFHWHKEFLDIEAEVKRDFGVVVPDYVVAQDGVPLLNVYRRPGRPGWPR